MDRLNIIDLYAESNDSKVNNFSKKLNSTLRVVTDYDKVDCNFEWLEMMEESIRYLDNILRNPNRFIINEEDIVKIELARRVTVESIKHLSRNTNLIQDYDLKTGDVKPSKILNINKEESFDTYENRFIYSLIQNMMSYINRKKTNLILESSLKNNKKFEYNAKSNIGREKVNIEFLLDSKIEEKNEEKDENGNDVAGRLDRLELQIKDLTNSEVYKSIARKHISLVTSPIKKTNVILKNVNFQYALNLWNYMQTHMDDDTVRSKDSRDYMDDGDLKQYIDETFLLDYLVLDKINRNEKADVDKSVLSEKLIGNVVERIIDINQNVSEEQLKNIVSKQYSVIKYKSVVNDKEIQKIFKNSINKYIERINSLKLQ